MSFNLYEFSEELESIKAHVAIATIPRIEKNRVGFVFVKLSLRSSDVCKGSEFLVVMVRKTGDEMLISKFLV